jgi:carboxymethylenebutenolidase
MLTAAGMADEQPGSYLAEPAAPNGKGVLVLHAWWGLNDFIRSLCDRFAAEGFVALAPDMYKGKVTASIEEAEKLLGEQDVPSIDAAISSAIDALQNHRLVKSKKVGAIGFSLGGFHAFRLADRIADDVAAMVIFYSTWGDPFEKFRGPLQGHFAENDPFEPEEAFRTHNLPEGVRGCCGAVCLSWNRALVF